MCRLLDRDRLDGEERAGAGRGVSLGVSKKDEVLGELLCTGGAGLGGGVSTLHEDPKRSLREGEDVNILLYTQR